MSVCVRGAQIIKASHQIIKVSHQTDAKPMQQNRPQGQCLLIRINVIECSAYRYNSDHSQSMTGSATARLANSIS